MPVAAPDTAWPDRALCYGSDPAMWDTDGLGEPDKGRAICDRCPVREDCLAAALIEEHGMSATNRAGIRGGLGPQERARVGGRKRGKRGARVAPPTCRKCDQPARSSHARYCQKHRPADADRQAARELDRRAAA